MDLISQCALRAERLVWRPGHGGFTFTVVCKATFELRPELSPLAGVQEAVTIADVYAGEAGALALASDLVPFKKRPEVLVLGHAYAPEGRQLRSLTVRVAVGEVDKALQVFGDHYFTMDDVLVEPERFARMPLAWERAAGGPDTSNPAGIPTGAAAVPDAFGRVRAPNLMPAGLVLTSRRAVVPPVGFGPMAPHWPLRAVFLHRHAAVWDPARWHERPLPSDIDVAYFNAAPRDQQRTLPFGDETIYLEHLHPRFPRLSTRLAPIAPVATADQGSGPQPLQLRCDTLIIDTARGLAMLVWRGHVPLDHPDRPGRVIITAPAAPQAWSTNWPEEASDESATLAPGLVMLSSAVLPFSGAGVPDASAGPAAFMTNGPAGQARAGVPLAIDQSDDDAGMTLAPGLVRESPVLPFGGSQEQDASDTMPHLELAPPGVSLPFVSSGAHTALPREAPPVGAAPSPIEPPWASRWDPPALAVAPEPFKPSEPSELPGSPDPAAAPPVLLAAITTAAEEAEEARSTRRPPAPGGTVAGEAAAAPEAEPEIDFSAYPAERCGAIAARVACDEAEASRTLGAEDLDAARWKRVHERRLDEIRAEAARGRKKLLVEYDAAYVRALEAHRGPIALEEYARIAEAAERGAIAEALEAARLPAGAWPHIHRVWIGRTAKDMRLGKQVRAAIEQVRSAENG
jgi:hypothetical protein